MSIDQRVTFAASRVGLPADCEPRRGTDGEHAQQRPPRRPALRRAPRQRDAAQQASRICLGIVVTALVALLMSLVLRPVGTVLGAGESDANVVAVASAVAVAEDPGQLVLRADTRGLA